MKKVLYAKFSRERSLPFQISTSITEENGVKTVNKKALTAGAESHIRKLTDHYEKLKNLYHVPELKVCECRLEEENSVVFPFLQGKSMENVLTEHVEAGDYEKVKSDISFLWAILTSAPLKEFQRTEEFDQLFGEVVLPEGQMAAEISNLDMIFANILVEEDKKVYHLVDYEWVFDFMVPVSFIFARSLLLHGAFQTLPGEVQEECYAIGGVKPEDVAGYYQMEVCFQKYVTGKEELYVLSKLYPKMKRSSFFLDYWNTNHVYYGVQLLGVPKADSSREEELHFSLHFQGEVKEIVELPDTENYQEFVLKPADTECILKLYYIEGETAKGKRTANIAECNAQVHYGDIYHFRENPMFHIKNDGFKTLSIGYIVYHRNDYLIKEGIELRLQNAHLQKRLNTFIWPYKAVRKAGRIVINKLKK